jgi:PAS domain S-box-containing protein
MSDNRHKESSCLKDGGKGGGHGIIGAVIGRIHDFFSLTFKGTAVLFLIPVIVIMTLVYTVDNVDIQRTMLKNELIKKGDMIASIAARSAELSVLSENVEQMNKSAMLLLDIRDVSFVTYYDNNFRELIRVGDQGRDELPASVPASDGTVYADLDSMYVFTAPVYTITARREIDLFHAGSSEPNARRQIGWVRIGLSKAVMDEAQGKVIVRGVLLGLLFSVVGIILVYIFITIATRPLQALIRAAKEIRKGGYAEVPVVSSRSEVGRLSEEFNRMSREIREREQKLRSSEAKIKAMFERVNHAIFRLDREGNIVLTNNRFNELCGPAESFGKLFFGERGAQLQYMQEAALGILRNSEERIRGRDDTEIIAIMSVYPEVDEAGEISGYDGYFVDITDKKKLEETLIQAQKMESVGLLAGGIAHDFNNILTGVLGYASLIKGNLNDADKLGRYADLVEKSASRAAALTQQLLGFARKGKYKVEPVNINDILRELIAFLRETFDRKIDINFDPAQDLPVVRGDSTQIYQAILNICINARDAMPEGGRLYIRTERHVLQREKIMDFFKVPQGEYARINITDTGSGMSPSVRRRIFEPFFTTKAVGKGTGLGLAMVYGIVKNHNGYLDVYSEPGMGTTMRFYIPAAQAATGCNLELMTAGGRSRKGTVLLIDDEEVIRELGKDILEAYNYSAFLASNGDEGIAVFRERKDDIQLVVLDMVMPGKNGKQVFGELRSIRPDVKVLISSGHDKDEYFQEMFDSGAVGFLQKPFVHADFILRIEESIGL